MLSAAGSLLLFAQEGIPDLSAQLIEASAMIDAAAGTVIAVLAFLGGFLLNSAPWILSIAAILTAPGD
jgi:hypothetical protein